MFFCDSQYLDYMEKIFSKIWKNFEKMVWHCYLYVWDNLSIHAGWLCPVRSVLHWTHLREGGSRKCGFVALWLIFLGNPLADDVMESLTYNLVFELLRFSKIFLVKKWREEKRHFQTENSPNCKQRDLF